jgi:hypothetical protein
VTDTIDHLKDVRVCGCGDCKQAVEDALAEFQKLSGDKCLHWYFTQITLHAVIVNLIANDPRVPDDYHDAIVEKQHRLQEHFITDDMLKYIMQQVEAIDAANALKAEGGKPN